MRGGWLRGSAVGAVLAAGTWWLATAMTARPPLDFRIYEWGGRAVWHDELLYRVAPFGHWFTYPPFAAALFGPFAELPGTVARCVWAALSVLALVYVCRALLALADVTVTAGRVLLCCAALLPLEPVRSTFALGQINLILLAAVLWDVQRARDSRWGAGVGIGLATAIKLLPGVFIVVLIAGRRLRSGIVAATTVAVSAGIGFLIAPHASARYWLHLDHDTSRVGVPYISNQSLLGGIARLTGGLSHVAGWWPAVSLGIAAVGTAVAVLYARSDDWLGATAVCGITMLLTSPVSWTHHWVWAIPALGLLLRARRLVAMALLTVIYPIMIAAPMWSTPHFGGPAEYGLHGLTSITANCFLLAGLALFVYLTTIAPGVSLTERTNLRLRLRPAAGQT